MKCGIKVEWLNCEGFKIFVNLMKIIGERDGFLIWDISYFENIYDVFYEDGDVEFFFVKLEFKLVLDMVN